MFLPFPITKNGKANLEIIRNFLYGKAEMFLVFHTKINMLPLALNPHVRQYHEERNNIQ
jgi:hypothetical protein